MSREEVCVRGMIYGNVLSYQGICLYVANMSRGFMGAKEPKVSEYVHMSYIRACNAARIVFLDPPEILGSEAHRFYIYSTYIHIHIPEKVGITQGQHFSLRPAEKGQNIQTFYTYILYTHTHTHPKK
jgi:hypothetical protein